MTIEELKNMSLEIVNKAEAEQRDLSEDENKALEEYKAKIAELRAMEDDKKEEKVDIPVKEGESEDKTSEEIPSESGKTEEEKSEDKPEDKEEKTDNKKSERNLNKLEIKKDIHMEKRNFSLVNAINSVIENRQFDDVTAAVINAGKKEARMGGVSTQGQIQLPYESRGIVSVGAEGEDVIAEDVFNVMDDLRARLVFTQSGAKYLNGLTNQVRIPIYHKGQAYWAGENETANELGGSFSNVTLSPKRLTATVQISKELLIMNNHGAEEIIRQDIVRALQDKLEATLLGDGAGDANTPKGLFNGLTATTVANYKDLVNLEAELNEKDVYDLKYIASEKARAEFRDMSKSSKGQNALVYLDNGNEYVDGTQLLHTSHVEGKKFLVGDFSSTYIASFGPAIDLTVDPYSNAREAIVNITVSAWVDAVNARPDALVAGTFGE